MITIEVSGGGILFKFDGNQHYLYDGEIEVPVNSLSLVVDESEMFTFYKAASNDIFLSGRYDDLGWSKEQLVEFYKNNMVANGGGSSITEIYVGTSADTVDPSTGEVHKEEGKKEWLCIVYKSEQGVYSLTKVNLNEFILEEEFASGLTSLSDGTVIGVVDPRQEKIITLYNEDGTSAQTQVALSVNESGFTVSHVQSAIDNKVLIDRRLYTAKDGEYSKATQEITFKSDLDNDLFKVKLSGDTELNSGSTNFVQNKIIKEELDKKADWLSAVTSGDVSTEDGVNTLSYYNRSGDTLFEIELPQAKSISGINGVDVASGVTTDVISGVVNGSSEAVVISYTPEGLSAATDDVLTVGEDGFKVGNIQTAIDEAIKNARKHKVIGDESTIHGEWTADNEKKLSSLVYIKKITSGIPEEVKERYQLVDAAGNNIVSSGNVSANIDIYKDSSLVEIYLGCSGDSVNETSGVVTKTECEVKEYLNYVYVNNLGKYYMTMVNLDDFLNVMKYDSGITEVSGTVIGVVDANSEKVVTTYTSSGASAITEDVLTVGKDGFKANNIQLAIDAKADIMRKLYDPVRADYITTSQTINFASQLNGELFDVKLSGDTELNSGSTNFVQNSAITKVIEDNEKVIAAAINDLKAKKADWTSAVTNGDVATEDGINTLSFYNRSGDTLFEIELPNAKVASGISGVHVESGETVDIISGVVDSASEKVVTSYNISGESAVTEDVLTVGENGFKASNVQKAIDAKADINHRLYDAKNGSYEASSHTITVSSENGELFDVELEFDDELDSGSTNAVQNKIIKEELDKKQKRNVELTQEAYDALVSAGTADPEVLYIITDSEPIDVAKYVSSAEVVTKQSAYTISFSGDNGSLFDVDIPRQSGGVVAGQNISIDENNVISVSAATEITSASTEVVQSKTIYNQLDGLRLRKITQEAYDYADEHGLLDPMTVYIIVDDNS